MSETTLSKRQQSWLDHLRAAEARGMTLVAYAAENDLQPKDLYNWKSRLIELGVIKPNGGSGDFRGGSVSAHCCQLRGAASQRRSGRVHDKAIIAACGGGVRLRCATAVTRPPNDLDRVYVYRHPVDMRKAINGLAMLVESMLCLDPFSAQLFVFCNRRRDIVKIVYWERNGFCLWMKKLEKDRFKWPREGDVITLDGQQLNWLLDGYHLSVMKPHQALHYQTVL